MLYLGVYLKVILQFNPVGSQSRNEVLSRLNFVILSVLVSQLRIHHVVRSSLWATNVRILDLQEAIFLQIL
jgi:hypothetical protein